MGRSKQLEAKNRIYDRSWLSTVAQEKTFSVIKLVMNSPSE